MSQPDETSTDEPRFEQKDPGELSAHPVNDKIYNDDELDEEFVESVREKGVLEPVVVKAGDGVTIISGHRRVKAARQVGLDAVPAREVSFDGQADEIQSLIDFNRQRDKTKGEKIREGKWYLDAQRTENKEALREAGRKGGEKSPYEDEAKGSRRGENPYHNSDSYKEAAETVGVGKDSLNRGVTVLETAEEADDEDEDVREVAKREMQKLDEDEQSFRGASENVEAAKELRELADSDDETVAGIADRYLDRVKADEVEARDAIGEAKKEIKKYRHQQLSSDADDVLDTDFDVLVADPPWPYDEVGWRHSTRPDDGYPPMRVSELADLHIPAADDAMLWLWFENPFAEAACRLADAWGFDQRSLLTWDKQRNESRVWLRNRTKHALFCTRGDPEFDLTDTPSILRCRAADHADKPARFYEIVDDSCYGAKIELFESRSRDGWAALGSEILPGDAGDDVDAATNGHREDHEYNGTQKQIIRSYADLILEYPDGRFAKEDLERDVLKSEVKYLSDKGILVPAGTKTVINADGNGSGKATENTRYEANEYVVADEAKRIAEEAVETRELTLPCGHTGLQNEGGRLSCSLPICDQFFDRDELAVEP